MGRLINDMPVPPSSFYGSSSAKIRRTGELRNALVGSALQGTRSDIAFEETPALVSGRNKSSAPEKVASRTVARRRTAGNRPKSNAKGLPIPSGSSMDGRKRARNAMEAQRMPSSSKHKEIENTFRLGLPAYRKSRETFGGAAYHDDAALSRERAQYAFSPSPTLSSSRAFSRSPSTPGSLISGPSSDIESLQSPVPNERSGSPTPALFHTSTLVPERRCGLPGDDFTRRALEPSKQDGSRRGPRPTLPISFTTADADLPPLLWPDQRFDIPSLGAASFSSGGSRPSTHSPTCLHHLQQSPLFHKRKAVKDLTLHQGKSDDMDLRRPSQKQAHAVESSEDESEAHTGSSENDFRIVKITHSPAKKRSVKRASKRARKASAQEVGTVIDSLPPAVYPTPPSAPQINEKSDSSTKARSTFTFLKADEGARERSDMEDDSSDYFEDDEIQFVGLHRKQRSRSGSSDVIFVDALEVAASAPDSPAKKVSGDRKLVKTSAKRTPIQKLQQLMMDIFEADDAYIEPDDREEGETPPECAAFFAVIDGHTVLRSDVIFRVLKTTWSCSKADATSIRLEDSNEGPLRLRDLSIHEVGRLLRILERGLKLAEGLEPFKEARRPVATLTGRQSRGNIKGSKKSKGKDLSLTHDIDEEGPPCANADGVADEPETLGQLSEKFGKLAYSVLSANCILSIMAGDELAKPLLSEDAIQPCFEAVKAALDNVILPFVDACNGSASKDSSSIDTLISALAPSKPKGRKQKDEHGERDGDAVRCANNLEQLFKQTCAAFSQAHKLIRMPSLVMSETIVNNAVYAAIGPFFAGEPDAGSGAGTSEASKAAHRGRTALAAFGSGVSPMKSLRLPTLNFLRRIFARQKEQRQWIIEEILANLTKLPDLKRTRRQHVLRNGKTISSVTALLLHLIQSAAHGLDGDPKDNDSDMLTLDKGLNESEEMEVDTADVLLDKATASPSYDLEALRNALEGPNQAALAVANYLVNRISPGKATRSSTDNSYAAILEQLVGDLQTTMFLPQWPAAALLLSQVCRGLSAFVDDPKAAQDARGIAIEHLGSTAARMRESQLRIARQEEGRALCSIRQIQEAESGDRLDSINDAYELVIGYLARTGNDDPASETAVDFVYAQWACELSSSLIGKTDSLNLLEEADDDGFTMAMTDATRLRELVHALHHCMGRVASARPRLMTANSATADVFKARSEDDYPAAQQTAEELVHTTSFVLSYDFLRAKLLLALDDNVIGNRNKALRGINSMSAVDDHLLDDPSVRQLVEFRVHDESASVREAALALLSKHTLSKAENIESDHTVIFERIFDTGLAVRKRALKTLESVYEKTTSEKIRLEAIALIIRCVNDEDDTVQDMAVDIVGRLWFGIGPGSERPSPAKMRARKAGSEMPTSEPPEPRSSGLDRNGLGPGTEHCLETIISVTAKLQERPSPLESIFRRLFKKLSEGEASMLTANMRILNDAMIDSLVAAEEAETESFVNRVKTVHLFVHCNPTILSITKAKALVPYLKSAESNTDVLVMELLLKIFGSCLPSMPRTALKFAEDLQRTLTPLVSKPPNRPGSSVLQELIACYCTVIKTHTHNFAMVAKSLQACLTRLDRIRQMVEKGVMTQLDVTTKLIMSMTALFTEKADVDALRREHPECAADIDLISKGCISDQVFDAFLALYHARDGVFRSASLQCMGFLFRAFPSLMIRESTFEIMDDVFDNGKMEDRDLLLRVIMVYLSTEQARYDPEARCPAKTKRLSTSAAEGVDMGELVGNTDQLAESGVGATLIQRYLSHVLGAALRFVSPQMQGTAMDVLHFTVMQGLCHPLDCVPTLVALETQAESRINGRALQLHDHLWSKHISIIATRYLEMTRTAFEYQIGQQQRAGDLRGFRMDAEQRPCALLQPWYSLVGERRDKRLDFFKALTRALDVDTLKSKTSEADVHFARFVADNLATLHYNSNEEVFFVIDTLKRTLSIAGVQVLEIIEGELDNNGDESSDEEEDEDTDEELADADEEHKKHKPNQNMARGSKGKFSRTTTAARMATVMGIALLLRNHLKALYGLTEARCAKYSSQPKRRNGPGADKAQRKDLEHQSDAALDLSLLSGAFLVANEGNEELSQQHMMTFEELMRQDGTIAEPEDDFALDD